MPVLKSEVSAYEYSLDDLVKMFAKNLQVNQDSVSVNYITDHNERVQRIEVKVDKVKDK